MKKIATIALALVLPFAANAEIGSEVKNYVDQKVLEAMPDTAGILGVNSTGYEILNDGYSTVSVSIEEIKSHSNGSEITLGVINWMGVTLTGLKFIVGVSDPENRSLPDQEVSLSEVRPAKEVLLKFRTSTKPDAFDRVNVIFLGASGIRYSAAK